MRNHIAFLDHPVGYPDTDRFYDPTTAILGGGSIFGGIMSSDAAQSAADTQAASANRATDLQNQNYQQTRNDLKPYMQGGTLAQQRLNYLLGLSPNDAGGSSFTPKSTAQLRSELLPLYTREGSGFNRDAYNQAAQLGLAAGFVPNAADYMNTQSVDEAGLQSAIEKHLADQAATQSAYEAQAKQDPNYGSLTKKFSIQDFYNNVDPGYQWQLQQGQQALQNSQAAQNGVLGGAALKDLIGYNQGMASTAYNDAFNRYQTQNQNTYNRLAGLLQVGENAAAGSGTIGATMSGNMANTVMSAGNAQAAGIVGAANGITGGINGGMGYYMMNKMMNQPSQTPYAPADSMPYNYDQVGAGLPFMGA